MVDDDDDGFPSPEPRTDSRSALPRCFRAWQLRILKRDESFSLVFSPRNTIYGVGVGVGEASGGPQGRGVCPPPSWIGGGPPGLHLLQVFFIFSKKLLREVQVIPRMFVSAHK